MENKEENIVADDLFYVRIYKDGRVERLLGTTIAPPSTDTKGPVLSKDIVISHEPPISARLYLPNNPPPTSSKLPVVVYFHGGAFIFESAMSVDYQKHLETLAAEARVIIVSVEYRLAPEHPIPAAYDDSWVAVQWVGSHSDGQGPEEWLNDYADLTRVFFAGESAGANIAHRMGLRVGVSNNFLRCLYGK